MAKERKLNKIDPVRRNQISELMRTSRNEETYTGDVRREQQYIERVKPSDTVLRWFRVLTNAEAAAASEAGLIFEEDLANNDMVRRTMNKCVDPHTEPPPDPVEAEEPEPSMWGIELTRYNCDLRYRDRKERYALIRWPAIQSGANLTEIGTDLKDERVLCWWNSNSGHWEVLENPAEGATVPPEATDCCMDFVQVCTNVANECCLLEGIRIHVDPVNTTNFCTPKTCIIPIWLWCYQGLRAGQEVDLPIHHCEFGKLIKSDFYCLGDTRDVYGIKCGPCSAPCPRKEVKVTLKADECIAEDVVFTAYCVNQDPIAADGLPGFWGEFEITGEYPVYGIPIPVEPFVYNHEGTPIDVDVVYVVVGCRSSASDNLCEADLAYIDVGGGTTPYIEYDGPFTVDGAPGAAIPILDENDCVRQCSRTYRYGIYFRCQDGALFAGKFYRLHRGSMASDGVLDDCNQITVPEPDDATSGGDDIDFSIYNGAICETFDRASIDADYSSTFSCSVMLMNAVGTPTITANPYLNEVLGGCRSWQVSVFGIPACVDAALNDFAVLEFDWSGSDECKDQ